MTTQLERLCEKESVKCDAVYGVVELPEGWARDTHPYKVTLRYQRRRLTVPFFMGSALTREPTAADVIACLCSDASVAELTFDEFCAEMGLDSDSRKAEKTYKACCATAPRLRRFLGDMYQEFATAEH